MRFDYSLSSAEQWNIDLYLPSVPNEEYDGVKLEADLRDARNHLPPDLVQNLVYDRISMTQSASHKPRAVSDSAVILGQSYNNSSNTLQGLSHGSRHQRTLSVGYQPYFSVQPLETSPGNSAPGNATEVLLGSGETFEGHFGTPQDSSGTASGPGYDGTQPIAYIQVNDPQRYLLQPMHSAPGFDNHTVSSRRPSENEAHSEVNSICPQPDGQVPLGDNVAHGRKPTSHGRVANQPPSHESTPGLYSHPNAQIMSSLNPGSEPRQYSSIKAEIGPGNKTKDRNLNNHRPTKTSTQIDPETRDSNLQVPDRGRAGNGGLNDNDFDRYTGSAAIHSTMHTQSMPPPTRTQGFDSAGLDYALEMPHNSLQGQAMAESSVGNAPAPKLNIVIHSEGDLASGPITRRAGYSPHPGAPHNYQPPISHDYIYPPHGVHTWSHNPLSPVVGSEFQPTSVIAVPAPRRSLNFGAFLTPDPPHQISNIDLPPRPGTSPPQRTSVPNGRPWLLPNTGRRRSEQTWQSHGSQFDRVQLPPALSLYPGNTDQIAENHSHAPPSLEVPRTQTQMQGNIRREANCAVETCELVTSQAPNYRPLANDTCTSRPVIRQPAVTSVQEGLGVHEPGQLQGHAPVNHHRQKQLGQQHHTVRQNQSNSDQIRHRASLQTQSATPTIQSGYSKEQINQQPQPLNLKPSTRVVPPTSECHGSGREITAKRKYNHSNPENSSAVKKRKVGDKDPRVTSTEPDSPLIPPSQCQQQNLSTAGQDCVYFDVNTWRGDNIVNQVIRHRLSVGNSTQTQLQAGDGGFMERSQGELTGDRGKKPSENVSSSEPSQASYCDGGTAPLAGSESWLPVGQGEGASGFQYMNWDASANMLLDQTLAFNLEMTGSRAGATEQYALNPVERPAPEATVPVFPLTPSNFEIDELLADYYNWGIFSAVA